MRLDNEMTFSAHNQASLHNKCSLLCFLHLSSTSRLLPLTSVKEVHYFYNHSDIKPYRLELHLWCWYWWCHHGPVLKHWLSLIRLWHCCSLCVPMVTMCGVYFSPTKAAMSIKLLVSIFVWSRRFFIQSSETHLSSYLILIKWRATILEICP